MLVSLVVVPLSVVRSVSRGARDGAHALLGVQAPACAVASRLAGALRLADAGGDSTKELRRKETLKQIFGDSFRDREERELARVTKVDTAMHPLLLLLIILHSSTTPHHNAYCTRSWV
jgi:hypothetical protein